jgi:tetratricopeptide (TPR) repeat protein
MGILRSQGTGRILLAACLVGAGVAHAACTGPKALVSQLHDHPSEENAVVLGSWYASHQQFLCAIETFRAALKTNPESPQLEYLVGLALIGADRDAEAIPDIEKSVELAPEVLKPHLMLAHLYDEAGHHDLAEEQWKKALKIDPHSTDALEGLSGDLAGLQEWMEVLMLLRSAPRTEKLSIRLAQALEYLNDLDDAYKVLNEARSRSPKSIDLVKSTAGVLVKQLRYNDAIDLWQQTLKENPGNPIAELQLFRILVRSNHITAARPMAAKILAQHPHDPEVLYLNGIVARLTGDFPRSKAYLEEAVRIKPDFYYSRFNLGMVLVILREWPEAKEQLEKAIAMDSTQSGPHFELAKALRELGETERAQQELKMYQKIKSDDEAALEAASAAAQGDKSISEGKVDEALQLYRQAEQDQPQSANYKYEVSIALDQAGKLDEEKIELEAAVKLDPALAGAQKQLGYLLARSGDAAGAVEHFRMAVKAAPAWSEAWINLAAELAVEGNFAEALPAAETALRLDPSSDAARRLNDRLAQDAAAQGSHP